MRDKFSRTELSNSILMNRGQGKDREVFVEQMLELQNSSEDGRIEFEGKNGTYVFTKNDNIVTFKKGNGSVVRKKLEV